MFPGFDEFVSTELTVSEYSGDHTETDAAHPEDKTVEISCAIL